MRVAGEANSSSESSESCRGVVGTRGGREEGKEAEAAGKGCNDTMGGRSGGSGWDQVRKRQKNEGVERDGAATNWFRFSLCHATRDSQAC